MKTKKKKYKCDKRVEVILKFPKKYTKEDIKTVKILFKEFKEDIKMFEDHLKITNIEGKSE